MKKVSSTLSKHSYHCITRHLSRLASTNIVQGTRTQAVIMPNDNSTDMLEILSHKKAILRATAQPAHAVRPLRARDRCYFGVFLCSALAAADAQLVGRVSCRKLSRSRTTLAGAVAHERCAAPTERIARGMNARCAVCGLGRRFRNPGAYEGPWYGVWFRQRGSAERWCR